MDLQADESTLSPANINWKQINGLFLPLPHLTAKEVGLKKKRKRRNVCAGWAHSSTDNAFRRRRRFIADIIEALRGRSGLRISLSIRLSRNKDENDRAAGIDQ